MRRYENVTTAVTSPFLAVASVVGVVKLTLYCLRMSKPATQEPMRVVVWW